MGYLEIPSDSEKTRLTAQESMIDFARQDLRDILKEVAEDLAWLPEAACDPDAERAAARIVARGKLVDFKTHDTEPEKTSKAHFTIDHVSGHAVQIAFWANVFGWGSYVVLAPFGRLFLPVRGRRQFRNVFTGGLRPVRLASCNLCHCVHVVGVQVCSVLFAGARGALSTTKKKHIAGSGTSEQHLHLNFLRLPTSFLEDGDHRGCHLAAGEVRPVDKQLLCRQDDQERHVSWGINKTWSAIWSHSSFLWCPLDLWQVVICMWFLMLLQPLYAFLYCCPLEWARLRELVGWDPSNETYKVKDRDLAEGKFVTYKCCMDEKSHCGDALVALSYAGRLSSDQFFVRDEKRFLISKKAYVSGQIYNFLKQQILFSLVFQMLVLFCQVEMSGTAIELLKSLDSHHRVDAQLVVGVSLNVVMGFKNVIETALYILELAEATNGAPVEQKDSKGVHIKFNELCKERTPRLVAAWGFCVLVFAVGIVHAITKLVMVTLVCDGGWNFNLPLQQGCVPVQGQRPLFRV